MTRKETLDLYFLDARARLIDLAAFLDRVRRAGGGEDFRLDAFRAALSELGRDEPNSAGRVLTALSDPTIEPVATASAKGANGAWLPSPGS